MYEQTMVQSACCGFGSTLATMPPDDPATTQVTMGSSQTAVMEDSCISLP